MDLPPPFEFDRWRAEPDRNALISSDGESRLGSRVMAVLVRLAGSGGRVVPREELLETVWNGRAVTDDALTVAVHDLRKALGDRPSAPRFVETIPGRGYRWLVPVRVSVDRTAPSGLSPARRPLVRRRLLLAATGLALGAAGVLAAGWWSDGLRPGEETTVRVPCGRINPEVPQAAVDAYYLGLEAARDLTPEGFHRAAAYYEEAAELAPNFSLAHALLADALLNLSFFPSTERAELSLRARAEIQEALALDPTMPVAHLLRGIMSVFLDWNLEAAEEDFWRAIQLEADLAPAHERYAVVLAAQGRLAAAEVRLRHALELAPSRRFNALSLGQLLISARKPAEALEVLPPGDAWEPPLLHYAWYLRGRALAALGRDAEACGADLDFLRRSLPQLDIEPYRRACAIGGLAALHELWLETVEESTGLYLRAALSLGLGRVDAALSWLWQMHRERDPLLLWIAHDPSFDALGGHPDFQRLLDSVHPYDADDPPSVSATSHPSWPVRAPGAGSVTR